MADTDGEIETEAEAVAGGMTVVEVWLAKIERARKDMDTWHEDAEEAVTVYEAGDPEGKQTSKPSFNIFHSSVETKVPALYNSTPIPDIRRRYGDPDPIGKLAIDVVERALSYSLDQYDIDGAMTQAVKDDELTALGQVRIRYDVAFGDDKVTKGYEGVKCEHVTWSRWGYGPARHWAEVPWMWFDHDLTKDDLATLGVDKERLDRIGFATSESKDCDDDSDNRGILKTVPVIEIWDKDNREVLFITKDEKDAPLLTVPDPLELVDFFPTPKPLMSLRRRNRLEPRVPYQVHKPLYDEIDRITKRINKLIGQLKVRGVYNSALKADLTELMKMDDGQYMPAEDASALAQGAGGLDKAVVHWPLEPIIMVLRELYTQREQVKGLIYEATGISDILRGQSNPNETLGAQQIKAQWGSQRVQAQQREVARFARDLLRLKAEVIATKFSDKTLQDMTQLPSNPQEQQLWSKVMELLRSDAMRGYRIDIETDSTVRADMTRSQEQMNLFLQGTAQYAQAMLPLVQAGPQMMPPVIEIYAAFARKFKLGKQAEDALDGLSQMAQQMAQQAQQQAQQPQPNPDAEKAKMDMEMAREKHGLDMQMKQADMQFKQQGAMIDLSKQQQSAELAAQKAALPPSNGVRQ